MQVGAMEMMVRSIGLGPMSVHVYFANIYVYATS